MSVYPTFPESPEPGDLFPTEPDPDETQFEFLGAGLGWAKKVIALQDVETGYPVWPGRLTNVIATVNGGGGGGEGGGGGGG
jgi:hypothetical protein